MATEVFYHVWFSPKRRQWLLQGDIETTVRGLLTEVAKEKGIKLLASEVIVDHIHLLLGLAPSEDLSKAVNLLKGVTARRVFQAFPELKLDAATNHLWQKRYGWRQISQGAVASVAEYIRTQWDRLEGFDIQNTAP